MMAARPTTPTTTPAAIPAVFGLLSESLEAAVFVGVAEAEDTTVDEGATVDDFFDEDDESGGIS